MMKTYYRKKYKKQDIRCSLTQSQANKVWEDPGFPIQSNSAVVMNTMWFTAFYSPLIPVGIILSLGALIYEYWIFKVNIYIIKISYKL